MKQDAFTKDETLEFINHFKNATANLEQPMISWYGDGAYELEEARRIVDNGFIPEGIVVCAKIPHEEHWESVFIMKRNGEYSIEPDDMGSIPSQSADNAKVALEKASALLFKLISRN